MLSDWPLGGRGGIWLPAPDRENSKPIMAKPGNSSYEVNSVLEMAPGKAKHLPVSHTQRFQPRGSHLPSSNAEGKLCRHEPEMSTSG